MNERFCLYCGKEVNYVESTRPTKFFVRGLLVEYDEIRAHCPICKREIYVSNLHDLNCINREKAYKRAVEEMEYE